MPAPKNKKELFELLERSNLLDPAQMRQTIEESASVADNPTSLCEWLMQKELITKFHAEQLLAGRHKGFTVGKYKILALVGAGGMGRVYLAEHMIMRRRVALKILPKGKGTDPSGLARFQREARAVAALNHPNIVQAYDIDQDGDLHYIVMEFVEGKSLQEIVREDGPLPWGRACNYVCQSANGLEHASQSGLVHRDIKPGNILVDMHGTVKLLDMGLAVFSEDKDKDSITIANQENVLGTADYLAPEQALDSHNVDIRADIYSLGGTLYFMLTGGPPFPDGTVAQKLLWHQSKMPRNVQELIPDVPDGVVEILNKMMAKKPGDRFPTPADLSRAMRPFAEGDLSGSSEAPVPAMPRDSTKSTDSMPVIREGGNGPGRAVPPRKPSGIVKKSDMAPAIAVAKQEESLPWETPARPAPNPSTLIPAGGTTPANSPRKKPQSIAEKPAANPFGSGAAVQEASPADFFNGLSEAADRRASSRLSEEFVKPVAQAKPPTGQTPVVATAASPDEQSSNKLGLWIGVGVGIAVVLLIAGAIAFVIMKPAKSPGGDHGGGTEIVGKDGKVEDQPEKVDPLARFKDFIVPTKKFETVDVALMDANTDQPILLKGSIPPTSTLKITKDYAQDGISIEGENPTVAVLRPQWDNHALMLIEGRQNITIKNLTFDGNNKGGAPCLHIKGPDTKNITLENVTFKNMRTNAIKIEGAEEVKLVKTTIHMQDGSGHSIIIEGAGNRSIVLQDCTLDGDFASGILVTKNPVNELTMTNCTVGLKSGINKDKKAGLRTNIKDQDFKKIKITGTTFKNLNFGVLTEGAPAGKDAIIMTDDKFPDTTVPKGSW